MTRPLRAAALFLVAACATSSATPAAQQQSSSLLTGSAPLPPPPPPAKWLPLIGEYGPDSAVTIILERGGQLWRHDTTSEQPLIAQSDTVFTSASGPARTLAFHFGSNGRVAQLEVDDRALARRQVGPESGNQLVITPVRPIAELRREALAASPPKENGPFLKSDLVELTSLDPTIKLQIRYATSNNLFGTPFYSQARAFLQRPAAEALVRANASLKPLGYGLLVHDGYRPWYVTKMFWDATPPQKHVFVADPSQGSRHNRGAAVDLTLYDLKTGAPIEMVSTYDETTDRAYPNYPGGTSRQRWYRALLRRAMEAQGFTVYDAEWWHFDFHDWQRFAIGNTVFEDIPRR
ncbi:MAG TPA: M15 family metallopeptidase [Gemmatimonadaceae bacterium]|nr:M15 family metallopeptidase [Gemmatimonadaceae bacterium]